MALIIQESINNIRQKSSREYSTSQIYCFIMSVPEENIEKLGCQSKNSLGSQPLGRPEGVEPLAQTSDRSLQSKTAGMNRPTVSPLQNEVEGILLMKEQNSSNECIKIFLTQLDQEEFCPSSEEHDEVAMLRKGIKYLRSSNNSYKKFCSVARNILLKNLSANSLKDFRSKYKKYKSSRTYFFVILIYLQYEFTSQKKDELVQNFINKMNEKCDTYRMQITKTGNQDLKKFRAEEIKDIQYSIDACLAFARGSIEQAIEIIYKKDKDAIFKKEPFEHTLKAIRDIELALSKRKLIRIKKEIAALKQQKTKLREAKEPTDKHDIITPEPAMVETPRKSQLISINQVPILDYRQEPVSPATPVDNSQNQTKFLFVPYKKFVEKITAEDDEEMLEPLDQAIGSHQNQNITV